MANMGSGSLPLARLAAIVLLAGMILGLVGPRLWASGGEDSAQAVHVVNVGESLWELAKKYAPGKDPRVFAYEVRQLNGLSQSYVFPGQRLIIPSG